MKAKTINSIITAKFNCWVKSIKDEAVQKAVKNNTIMSGGAIASMLLNEPVHDFDFYFRNVETAAQVANYYVAEFKKNPPAKFKNTKAIDITVKTTNDRVCICIKSAGIASETENNDDTLPYQYFETVDPDTAEMTQYIEQATSVLAETETEDKGKPKYRVVFMSSNAITLSDGVQLVLRFTGEPDQIHANYDFVHCTNYWTSWEYGENPRLVLRQKALEALLTKELTYIGSKYPICSLIRLRKFIHRGWTINAGQILKIVMQLHGMKLTDLAVLEEQLIGVDVAYFRQLMDYLSENYKGNPAAIDTNYLITVIDKIF